jgi:hypothetical protein
LQQKQAQLPALMILFFIGGDKITGSLKNYNFTPLCSMNLIKGSKCSPCKKLFNDMFYFSPRYIMMATVAGKFSKILKAYNN